MGHADGRPRDGLRAGGPAVPGAGRPPHPAQSEIHHIIFDVRKEKEPLLHVRQMRRGGAAQRPEERGLNKIALGHHYDDAVETFFLSLIFEGRLSCFQPVTWLDRTEITQIRPCSTAGKT